MKQQNQTMVSRHSLWIKFFRLILSKIISILKRPYFVILICLTLLVIFVLDHFGLSAFWLDEAAVANVAQHSLKDIAYFASVDYHPIFYVYLLKFWAMIFGESEVALRSFSFLWAGVLAILIYWVANKIFQNRRIASLASILTSTNFFLIWFASETRPYTLAAVLGLLSFYFFWEGLNGGKKSSYVFYVIFSVLACYTHPWLNLVFAGEVLTLVVLRKSAVNFRTLLLAQIMVGLLAIPNLLIMLYIGAKLGATDWIESVPLSVLFSSIQFLSFGVFWLYFVFAVVAGILSFLPDNNKKRFNLLLFALGIYFLFPLIAAWAISQWKSFYIAGRYEMIVLPAFILLLAFLLNKIRSNVFLGVFIFLALVFVQKNVTDDRDKVLAYRSTDKTVVEGILQRINDDDFIIASYLSYPTVDYYLRTLNKTYHRNFKLVVYPQETQKHPALLYDNLIKKNPARFEQEAKDLVKNIKTDSNINYRHQIWVIENSVAQVNMILTKELEQNFQRLRVEQPPTPRENSWFDEVVIYQ